MSLDRLKVGHSARYCTFRPKGWSLAVQVAMPAE